MNELNNILHCREDGTFRILMISDIQESANYDKRSLDSVNILIERAAPDLVILGGDNCFGPEVNSLGELKAFLDVFTEPMESRGIPWVHIFGNHDHDVPCDIEDQQRLYESYPMCLSEHTDGTVHGKSNFVKTIFDRSCEKPVLNLWCLDSNGSVYKCADQSIAGKLAECAERSPDTLIAGVFDIIYFDQLMWYWNTSRELESKFGRKVPGLMCLHIAPHEFEAARRIASGGETVTGFSERLDPAALNSGLFAAVLQRGDIHTIACAHTHNNDGEAQYCGIRVCWDACAGFRCYGTDELRGGRLFEIHDDDPDSFSTRMIHTL